MPIAYATYILIITICAYSSIYPWPGIDFSVIQVFRCRCTMRIIEYVVGLLSEAKRDGNFLFNCQGFHAGIEWAITSLKASAVTWVAFGSKSRTLTRWTKKIRRIATNTPQNVIHPPFCPYILVFNSLRCRTPRGWHELINMFSLRA